MISFEEAALAWAKLKLENEELKRTLETAQKHIAELEEDRKVGST